MSLYENTEELFGDFEGNDYLCIRYLTYWNKAERRRQEVSKPLPIKVLLICKWLIIKGVVIRLTDTNGIEHMTQTIVYILICINVVTFLVYGIDKWKAKQGSWRISEATLLLLAVIGGSIGALLGMQVWHHKTMHKKFKYGLPLILLAQIALIYLIIQK